MYYSAEWEKLVSSFGYGFVDDFEQYRHIVKVWAYTDMQPRTIDGLGIFRKDPQNNQKLNKLFDELAEALYAFIINEPVKDEKSFDCWHKKQCENFYTKFNKITTGDVRSIGFGKAQKIINVSFKYIYCLKGADRYADKFEHCHMILDRYTYSEGFYKQEVIPYIKLRKTSLTSWSNLSYDEYIIIQSNIRNFLKKSTVYVNAFGAPLTPFQAEFYIFSKYNP